ncbi:MAG: oxalate decarboxylase [Acidobacteriaceae bacterium]|jgi:oxalate decarboxylase|nr:oxalate decarboxylase [Acidobacteriaceae bacterium]
MNLHDNLPDSADAVDTPTADRDALSRRRFFGTVALAGAGFFGASAMAQTRPEQLAGRTGNSKSDPGPENNALLRENPNSNMPPFTDHGNPGPIWYSFDLAPKRVQGGGWTHQVTQRELPSSHDLAGVNMRLTAGSFRELHWHMADEWAIMLAGKARVSIMQPDGKMFIDDVGQGDLWYFPAGFPHSIQGLEGDGCEFLLVFDEGNFSEDDTFLLSEFVAHTSPEIIQKNMGWSRQTFDQLPASQLYIFEAPLPDSLEADHRFLGEYRGTDNKYTFKMASMQPNQKTAGGETRIVDSSNFPVATNIASAMVTLKPGGLREMHWHPNVSEWQYWIKGKGRMTVVTTEAKARTMDFNANDVGYVPSMAGHSIENTGTEDLVFLEMFKAPRYMDISLNQWIARMPDKMAEAHLKLSAATIRQAPQGDYDILPK